MDVLKLLKGKTRQVVEDRQATVDNLTAELVTLEKQIEGTSESLRDTTKAMASPGQTDMNALSGIFKLQEGLREELADLKSRRAELQTERQQAKDDRARILGVLEAHGNAIANCNEEIKALQARIKYHEAAIAGDKSAVQPKSGPIIMPLVRQINELSAAVAIGNRSELR